MNPPLEILEIIIKRGTHFRIGIEEGLGPNESNGKNHKSSKLTEPENLF
jgi:hypothetical protein